MIRRSAVALWVLAGVADLLTWGFLGARERSEHIVIFLLVGSVVLAILGVDERRPGVHDVDADAGADEAQRPPSAHR